MSIRRILGINFIIIALLAVMSATMAQEQAEENIPPAYRVVGYYTSYSIYDAEYYVTDIPVELLTHLNYVSIDVSENGQCVSRDEWADRGFSYPGDTPSERLRGNFKQLRLLRADYPDLKILMTVGGWENSDNFSNAALTEESRLRFARSCVNFMREAGFNGIDIDWRYPVSGGMVEGRPEDKANYTLLLAALRDELETWAEQDDERYLLTITAPAVETLFGNIEIGLVHTHLDWINLMAFGFQGEWSEYASHHAPLYGNTRDPRGEVVQNEYNVDGAVNAYLDAGVPADKIVIGVPFYAQTWRNVRPNDYFGLYAPAEGVPTGTRPGGILYYGDILPLLQGTGYVRFFDEETMASWMYNAERRIAISYESQESILNKTAYVRSRGLGGVTVWELSYDDPNHTLLSTVFTGLNANGGSR